MSDLVELLDYHYWARDRILEAAARLTSDQFTRDLGSSFKSVRDTLVHIYSADWVWYSRWIGESPTAHLRPEDFPDVAVITAGWSELEQKVRELVQGLDDAGVERRMEYRLMNGAPGVSSFREMLQHMVNHGTYHRGQVTTMLRQMGAAPPRSMDLIGYFRELRN